jgi:hypothetical protein
MKIKERGAGTQGRDERKRECGSENEYEWGARGEAVDDVDKAGGKVRKFLPSYLQQLK